MKLFPRAVLTVAVLINCRCVTSIETANVPASPFRPNQESRSDTPEQVGFAFFPPCLKVEYGKIVELKARITNRSGVSIYIAHWARHPSYYWQGDGVVTARFGPFEYDAPKQGIGYVTASPAVLRPLFRELRPNEAVDIPLNVPPQSGVKWALSRGKWRVKLQHIWLPDIAPLNGLTGQQLLDALRSEGHFIWAEADLLVE